MATRTKTSPLLASARNRARRLIKRAEWEIDNAQREKERFAVEQNRIIVDRQQEIARLIEEYSL